MQYCLQFLKDKGLKREVCIWISFEYLLTELIVSKQNAIYFQALNSQIVSALSSAT